MNHSPGANAKYTVFTAHPVLGVIMAVVAVRDIQAGEEVTAMYDYPENMLRSLNWNLEDMNMIKDENRAGCPGWHKLLNWVQDISNILNIE